MLIFSELSMKPREEIDNIKKGIFLSEEESIIFDMAITGKTAQEISFKVHKSVRSIFYSLSRIRNKILNYYEYKGN